MYIPIITFPQSAARFVLKWFARDIITFDESHTLFAPKKSI